MACQTAVSRHEGDGAAPGRRTDVEIVEQVRRTLVHEVGHHLGIDDARLHELGR